MAQATAIEKLKKQISELETKRTEQGRELKAHLNLTYDRLKPINLLKDSAKEFATSAELRETILESSAILVAGFISKKLSDVGKGNPLVNLLSSFLQLGATNLVAKYSTQIQDFLMGLIVRLLKTKSKE